MKYLTQNSESTWWNDLLAMLSKTGALQLQSLITAYGFANLKINVRIPLIQGATPKIYSGYCCILQYPQRYEFTAGEIIAVSFDIYIKETKVGYVWCPRQNKEIQSNTWTMNYCVGKTEEKTFVSYLPWILVGAGLIGAVVYLKQK